MISDLDIKVTIIHLILNITGKDVANQIRAWDSYITDEVYQYTIKRASELLIHMEVDWNDD